MKIKMIFVAVLALAAANLMGGSKVKFLKTWKNPEAQAGSFKGKKVAAFVMPLMGVNKEGSEQALARELTQRGIIGVTGSSVIPPAAQQDKEAAKRLLGEAGIIGAVVMTVVDYKQEAIGSPGQPYPVTSTTSTYYNFYGYQWNVALSPAQFNSKTTLVIETLIYSLEQDKLVWRGTSTTTNPKEAGEAIRQLVELVGKELQKVGLVAKQ